MTIKDVPRGAHFVLPMGNHRYAGPFIRLATRYENGFRVDARYADSKYRTVGVERHAECVLVDNQGRQIGYDLLTAAADAGKGEERA